jgi:hypothetical protein
MSLNPLARSIGSLLFASSFFLSHGVHAQDIQGFDPKAKSVADFSLTPFYETNLDYIARKPVKSSRPKSSLRRRALLPGV